MAKAFVTTKDGKQVLIAESDETIRIEGNHYFPPESVNKELLKGSDTHTTCYWKGEASYKTVKVGDEEWADGAWYYPEPKPDSIDIVKNDFTNYFAFWRGVQVEG
ncbi:MAG TPA: DUF427 domain-containing protein [Candidatus Saccharimonadales bacterium]|jgi:uncharacterized protein (DUF427 family)